MKLACLHFVFCTLCGFLGAEIHHRLKEREEAPVYFERVPGMRPSQLDLRETELPEIAHL